MTTKICPICGNGFTVTSRHPNVKYCSHACTGISQRRLVTIACEHCGKMFQSKPGEHRRFCSQTCSNQFHQPVEQDKRSIFQCDWCGKSFEEYSYRHRRFCSRQCMSKYAARQPKPKARKPEIHITLTCKICGKSYQTTTHQVRERGSSCCSRECVAVLQSQLKRKEGNPNYRGGKITSRGPNWGHQSRKALRRDGYRCQICGQKVGRKKHDYGIHHIKPFREFDGDYENANRLSNLITLCRACHGKVEWGTVACPRPLPL